MKKSNFGLRFFLMSGFIVSILGVFFIPHLMGYLPIDERAISADDEKAQGQDKEVVFEIRPHEGIHQIRSELYERGLVHYPFLFSLYSRWVGGDRSIKVGEYALRRTMNFRELMSVLCSGKSIQHKVTLKEGLSIFEIGDVLEASGLGSRKEFLHNATDSQFVEEMVGTFLGPPNHNKAFSYTLEGYIFPETYSFTKFMSQKEVLIGMVKKFQSVYSSLEPGSVSLEIKNRWKEMGWSHHQIVTLASIIEKETGVESERPLVSSVFYNRMKKRMLLQTDPTIIYGKALNTQKIELSIHKKDILSYTPYNTYVISGLPPGPIANPGKASIAAALHPATTDYLFFVAKKDGTHVFSKDYKTHSEYVRKYQIPQGGPSR